jgi:hypothetical protein
MIFGWVMALEYKKVFFFVLPATGLLLRNYWCNFMKTFQEWSIPSFVVVQLINILWFIDFCQSFDTFMILILKFVCSTPVILLMQFQWNFTGLIDSSNSRAYWFNDFCWVIAIMRRHMCSPIVLVASSGYNFVFLNGLSSNWNIIIFQGSPSSWPDRPWPLLETTLTLLVKLLKFSSFCCNLV